METGNVGHPKHSVHVACGNEQLTCPYKMFIICTDMLVLKSHPAFSCSCACFVFFFNPPGGRKDTHEEQHQQKMVKSLKKHLKYLLQQPVFKNVMRTKYPTQMGKLALPDLPLAKYESALESLSSQERKEREKQRNMKKKKQQL